MRGFACGSSNGASSYGAMRSSTLLKSTRSGGIRPDLCKALVALRQAKLYPGDIGSAQALSGSCLSMRPSAVNDRFGSKAACPDSA